MYSAHGWSASYFFLIWYDGALLCSRLQCHCPQGHGSGPGLCPGQVRPQRRWEDRGCGPPRPVVLAGGLDHRMQQGGALLVTNEPSLIVWQQWAAWHHMYMRMACQLLLLLLGALVLLNC